MEVQLKEYHYLFPMTIQLGFGLLDLSEFDNSKNDFYNIYCNWSSYDGNIYNDFRGFQTASKINFFPLKSLFASISSFFTVKEQYTYP